MLVHDGYALIWCERLSNTLPSVCLGILCLKTVLYNSNSLTLTCTYKSKSTKVVHMICSNFKYVFHHTYLCCLRCYHNRWRYYSALACQYPRVGVKPLRKMFWERSSQRYFWYYFLKWKFYNFTSLNITMCVIFNYYFL